MRPEELRERRARAGLTIRALSELSGVSEATIGRIENGYRGARERTLLQLERGLERSPSADAWAELLEAAQYASEAAHAGERGHFMAALEQLDAAIKKIEDR